MNERIRDSRTLLTYHTYDDNGQKPSMLAIGTRLFHTGNGKTYTITGFAWNGDTDEWNYVHVGPDGIPIVRPLSHIEGERSGGVPRYQLVTDGT